MKIAEIIKEIEKVAPRAWQESWDNSGLQVGSALQECSGVLIAVDATPGTVDEAVSLGCNLIVTHHPLFFKGVKRLTGATPVEVTAMNAIAAGVSIYACHTPIDSAPDGVSATMARMLGLEVMRPLVQQSGLFRKLTVMVPQAHADSVRDAMFDAGAGELGGYSCCSFNVEGTGTFLAGDDTNPWVGEHGELHREPEVAVNVLVPRRLQERVVSAMLEVHPYEVPAYEIFDLVNNPAPVGLGVVARYDRGVSVDEFVRRVKEAFGSPVVRATTPYDDEVKITRVALCGGSASEFIPDAIAAGAQVFLCSDTRYHAFVDHANDIMIVDIGHFESEECTKEIFYQIITGKFTNFAVYKSRNEKNPIKYL